MKSTSATLNELTRCKANTKVQWWLHHDHGIIIYSR